jgi:hypothetical protein
VRKSCVGYNYNQKSVIVNFVSRFVKSHKLRSFLDIGAGFSETTSRFNRIADVYVAVEKNKSRAKKLEANGVNTICSEFPLKLNRSFDFILCSHSIPEEQAKYDAFIDGAWKLLSENGYLMIITFKGRNDDWSKIRAKLKNETAQAFEGNDLKILKIKLASLGKVVTKRIVSVEQSGNPMDIAKIQCDSFNEKPKRCLRFVSDELKDRYERDGVFYFPHRHTVLIVEKHTR